MYVDMVLLPEHAACGVLQAKLNAYVQVQLWRSADAE
jgi:hypothetical protein